MNRTQSEKLFEKAQKLLPGGVNSPVRAFGSVGCHPIFVKGGRGAYVEDVDGNHYLDYIGSWGPSILGHGHEAVLEGVMEQLMNGSSYGLPTGIEVEMAEMIREAVPSMEMMRMVSSGTEATMSAIRVARGFTGRDKILKFEGCYHGHSDGLLVKTGSGALTFGIPTSAGVSADTAKNTLVAAYNDSAMVDRIFAQNKGQIAAVILEPIAANMGVVPPDAAFLKRLREITQEEGTLLIFDEVITGFRVGYGGAQALYGIKPDLTCLGKIIGGGLPVGAYGGRREIMSMVAPLGPVYQAGTLSGNPVAMRMGMNMLTYLKNNPQVYDHIEGLARRLQQGMQANFDALEIPATVTRVKGLVCPFFVKGDIRSYEDVKDADTQAYGAYFRGMLEAGIVLPPSQFEAMFLSTAHQEADIERTIDAHRRVLAEMKCGAV